LAQFKAGQADAKNALEAYLISYPSGLYTEQARQFYRTFAP
jgi:TolA-binding protein